MAPQWRSQSAHAFWTYLVRAVRPFAAHSRPFDERDARAAAARAVDHGLALAAGIPGARFLALEQTGHELFPRAHCDTVIPAILDHTGGS